MNFSQAKIIATADTDDLRLLCELAGGSRDSFFIGANFSEADICGVDLRGYNLKAVNFNRTIIDEHTRVDLQFEEELRKNAIDISRQNLGRTSLQDMLEVSQDEILSWISRFVASNYDEKNISGFQLLSIQHMIGNMTGGTARFFQTMYSVSKPSTYYKGPKNSRIYLGGDFVWWRVVDKENAILVVGDSSGKGFLGALLSVMAACALTTALEQELAEQGSFERVKVDRLALKFDRQYRNLLAIAERMSGGDLHGELGLDACICIFRRDRKMLEYTNMGFSLWRVSRNSSAFQLSGGTVRALDNKNSKATKRKTIGLRPDSPDLFAFGNISISDDDIFLFLSDGAPNQRRFSDEGELSNFDHDQIVKSIMDNAPIDDAAVEVDSDSSVGKIVEGIIQSWNEFRGETAQDDDIFVLGLR